MNLTPAQVLSPSLQPPMGTQPTPTPSPSSSPPTNTSRDSLDVWGYSTASPIIHDFVPCCQVAATVTDQVTTLVPALVLLLLFLILITPYISPNLQASNVSLGCQSFCNLKSILDGSTGIDPASCETDFPSIVSCMADGRDHLPCCLEAGVPPACTDLCRWVG